MSPDPVRTTREPSRASSRHRADFFDYSGRQDAQARRAAKILATPDHLLGTAPIQRFGNAKEFARSSWRC
jgi:hypothetical protein